MARKRLTPGALYAILSGELRTRRSYECVCRMPLPFPIERPDGVSANWRIGAPTPCDKGCDAIIAEIAVSLWPQYDLHDPVAAPSEVEAHSPTS